MKTITKVLFYFMGLLIVTSVLFSVISDLKTKQEFEKKNELCIQITDEMNDNVNESSTCEDYYCYYARYNPPVGLEGRTETLCICDCTTESGEIVSSQILGTVGNLF